MRDENGKIKANQSKKIEIKLDTNAFDAFIIIRIIAFADVLLLYPNYDKPLELTTDSSSHGIGAVLTQSG